MKFSNWTNQYIGLVATKPAIILPCKNNKLDSLEIDFLRHKASQFSKVILEFGCGSGEHLIERAARANDTLFVGFEIRFKRSFRTAEKAEKRGLLNLVVVRHTARAVTEIFSDKSVDGIYVNFPDPWSDRRKWAKHRLLQPSFIAQMEKLLKPGGFISYKTDHQECFLETKKYLQAQSGLSIEKYTEDLYSSDFLYGNVTSEFEKLFCSKSLPVFYLEAVKTS